MLLALTTAGRSSELANLDNKHMLMHEGMGVEFSLTKNKKNRKNSTLPGKIFIPAFRDIDPEICPVSTLEHYLIATGRMGALAHIPTTENWEADPVLRKMVPPYTQVSPKTVSRWLTEVINPEHQGIMGHSTRGHAASAAYEGGRTIKQIMDAAEWQSESVFRQYYFHPSFDVEFGRSVLKKHKT